MAVIVESDAITENQLFAFENRLISGLTNTDMYSLIERRKLQRILDELKLQNTSGLVDENYAIDIGNFIGAEQIFSCLITDIENFYNIDCRITLMETSEIIASASTIAPNNFVGILNNIPIIIFDITGNTDESVYKTFATKDIPLRSIHISSDIFIELEPISVFKQDNNSIIDIISDNELFYSCSSNGKIIQWDPRDEFNYKVVFDNASMVLTSASLSYGNEYFASGSADGKIYLWETNRWGNPYQLKKHKTKVTDVTFSNNYTHFFSTDDRGNTIVWNYQYQKPVIEKNIFSSGIQTVLLNGDEKGIFIQGKRGEIKLFRINDGEIISTVSSGRIPSTRMVINPTKNHLACGFDDGYIHIYDISHYTDSRYINENWIKSDIDYNKKIKIFDSDISAIEFSPSSDILIVGNKNGDITIIDTINWKKRGTGKLGDSPITTICFITDQIFITGSYIGELGIWNLE